MLCCARMRGNFLSIRGLLAVAAVLSALLFAAGCGGSDESATGSSGGSSGGSTEVSVETGSLSKAAFIKQANTICANTWKQFEKELFDAYGEEQDNPPKPTEPSHQNVFFETGFPETYEQLIDEISKIGAPAGDEEEITAFLEALQKLLDESREDPETFNESFVQSELSFGKANQLANAYGLKGCLEEH